MKYYVIPNYEKINVEGASKELAMNHFIATKDLATYFKVVTESEYETFRRDKDAEGHKNYIENLMANALVDMGVEREDAENLKHVCYDTYNQHECLTEYEAIRLTYDETKTSELKALESMAQQHEAAKDFDGEIEIHITDDNKKIEVRKYIERAGFSDALATVNRSCVDKEDLTKICDRNHWHIA